MGSVLAFEGPDLAGKSSLISRLRDREPWSLWPMLRMDVPPALLRDPLHREWEVLSRAWNLGLVGFKRHMSFLLDRCYVSSLVYSRVYGRKADLSYIEKVEEELQPTIVYVHTPIEVLLRRFEAEGDRTLHSQRVLIAV